ncbi:MAG: hypothetical protein EOP04_02525 [Proteobacteria bacterium]|nr:MAG: hypothetical protein EOP04_02525 [Pseudomonadota bacterium]
MLVLLIPANTEVIGVPAGLASIHTLILDGQVTLTTVEDGRADAASSPCLVGPIWVLLVEVLELLPPLFTKLVTLPRPCSDGLVVFFTGELQYVLNAVEVYYDILRYLGAGTRGWVAESDARVAPGADGLFLARAGGLLAGSSTQVDSDAASVSLARTRGDGDDSIGAGDTHKFSRTRFDVFAFYGRVRCVPEMVGLYSPPMVLALRLLFVNERPTMNLLLECCQKKNGNTESDAKLTEYHPVQHHRHHDQRGQDWMSEKAVSPPSSC